MATKRIPILGFASVGDSTGECFLQSYPVLATNDVWKRLVLMFGSSNSAQPTVKHGIYGGFMVPKDFVSAPKIVFVWTATPTSGAVVWGFEYRTVGGNDTTSLDQTGTEESVTVTANAPTAANRRMETSVALTAANLSVDEEVEFYLFRDGTAGADTMAGTAMLFGAYLEYSDV